MRIALGQLWQETNTLNPRATLRADFEAVGIHRGDALIEAMQRTNELGGFIQSLRQWPERPEIVGLIRLGAWPAGAVSDETFDWLRASVLDSLAEAGPVDGVLFALHGAMVADGHPDAEGEILQAVREHLGPHVPLVATLDLHANVTRTLVQAADVLVTYHCLPHIDIFSTGERAAAVLRRLLVERVRPVTAYQKIPAVVPAENSNTESPHGVAADLKRRLVALEARGDVLSAGLTPVQPWMDIPELGSAVLITTADDAELARSECASLANEFWQRRREYLPHLVSIPEAIRAAREEMQNGLVVLSDAADATTSGAPGDSVWLLEELLRHEWPGEVLVPIVAADVVSAAQTAAIGTEIDTILGGTMSVLAPRDGEPATEPKRLELRATIERRFDARFIMTGHIGNDLPIDMGPSVVLRRGNVRVLATSRSGPHFAPEFFRSAGFDPFAATLLIAKSPCGFRAVYEGRAAAIHSVQAPGCAPSDFWNYPFQNIPHPTWPWHEITNWEAEPELS